MPFLPPNQQCQSIGEAGLITHNKTSNRILRCFYIAVDVVPELCGTFCSVQKFARTLNLKLPPNALEHVTIIMTTKDIYRPVSSVHFLRLRSCCVNFLADSREPPTTTRMLFRTEIMQYVDGTARPAAGALVGRWVRTDVGSGRRRGATS